MPKPTPKLSPETRLFVGTHCGCDPASLEVQPVSGGYSRNVRALLGRGDTWVFAKEVDLSVLPGDGVDELSWLRKDYDVVETLRKKCPDVVPEWSMLLDDGHTLLLPAYRAEDGWVWSPPHDDADVRQYVDSIVKRIVELEGVELDVEEVDKLRAAPHFRDKLALDGGMDAIIADVSTKDRLKQKYVEMLEYSDNSQVNCAIHRMVMVLDDAQKLQQLSDEARSFAAQPNDSLGHCDVRSDNIAYNVRTGDARFVDWNWMSYTPKLMGSTEFLIDMARRGIDVEPWATYLNPEMLAAVVGFYAKRCLDEPLAPGNTLRVMQAESAAIALILHDLVA